jgi:BirA family biotin operon repressor/biotin-[acetyl-CoA-carboxylase] ligase
MSAENSVTEMTLNWAYQRELFIESSLETESTNDDARGNALKENADLVLYITAHQTKGRGRGTNTWLDTGLGDCLLSTWSLAIANPPQAITAPRIGLALFEAARKTWPSLSWGLKAPNDLYLEGKKIAGLLVETVSSGKEHRLLVGLGMNVFNHPRSFANSTHLNAALALSLEAGDWYQFLDDWRAQLNLALVDIMKKTLSSDVREELALALNANTAKPFVVDEVTPEGDLKHKGGIVRWTEI